MSDPWSQFPDAPAADPWAAFPDAPAADPWAAFPDAQAPGGTDTPPPARAPELTGQPEEPGFFERQGRNLMLGAQAVGRGGADLLTTLPNLANAAANIGLTGADIVADKAFGARIPYRFDTQLDQRVADAAGGVAEAAGVPLATPETPMEKAIYSGTRYGTQAIGGAAALTPYAVAREGVKQTAGATPRMFDNLVAPYAAAPSAPALNTGNTLSAKAGNAYLSAVSPLRSAAAGDAAAGFGSGVALDASQKIPEEYRAMGGGSVGTIADFLAMLAGAGAGSLAKEAVVQGPISLVNTLRSGGADPNIPLDPETMTPTSRRVADMAGEFAQGRMTNPAKVAENIGTEVAAARAEGRPIPTSGFMSGDVGMESLERGVRGRLSTDSLITRADADPGVKAQYSFGSRDRQLQDAAVDAADSIRDPNANPRAFTEGVRNVLDDRMAQRTSQVGAARQGADAAAASEAEIATNVGSFRGRDVEASTNIDRTVRDTLDTERTRKNTNFNDPVVTQAEVPADPLRQVAARIDAENTELSPVAPVVQQYVDRINAAPEGSPTTMGVVNNIRADIEADIIANSQNGRIVRQLRQIKDTINQYADTLSETDAPAGEAVRAALGDYRERWAPNFGRGVGGQYARAVTQERTPGSPEVKPSETGARFLTTPEDADALMRIARLGGNEADVAAQARTWLFDKLAQKGISTNGRLNPDAMARWRTDNRELLRRVPGLDAEVEQLTLTARNRGEVSRQATEGLRQAEARLRGQERFEGSSTVGQVARSKPSNAIKTILSAPDPRAAAREVIGTIGFDANARKGLGAALADEMLERIKNTNASAVSEGSQPVGYAKLIKQFRDNREVLAEIFSPEEMNALQRAQKILEPLGKQRGQATSGSPTVERISQQTALLGEAATKLWLGMIKGGGVWRSLKLAASTFGGDEAEQINRLMARMIFDPELAQHLATRNIKEVGTPGWNAKLQKIIRYNEAVTNATDDDEDRPRNEITVTPRPQ
jgi:hypothetical protein